MKTNGKFNGHQGDIQFFSIDCIPANAKKIDKTFIAKSERSGHSHTLCGEYDMYEVENGYVIEIKDNEAVLNHVAYNLLTEEIKRTPKALPKADHEPTFIKKGIYFFGIQKRKKHFSKIWESVAE